MTVATFAPHVGSTFAVVGGRGRLVLEEVVDGGAAPSPELRSPFTLEFSGDVDLEQRIYELDHPNIGRVEIFLVRTGPTTYEAVFA